MNVSQRVAALCAVCGLLATPVLAQAPATSPLPAASPAPAASAAPATRAPDAAARPVEGQGALRALAGSWDVAITVLVRGQPPAHYSGKSENAWVVGGRFLQSTFSATGGGTTLDGITTYGYDARRQEYFAVNVNTSAVPYSAIHGPYYDGSRSFVLRSETAVSGGVRIKRRQVIRVEGDDKHVLEVYVEYGAAPPAKVLEAVSTRR